MAIAAVGQVVPSSAQAVPPSQQVPPFSWGAARTPYVVVVFLSPECPLCQRYTVALNALAVRYAGRATVLGVFAGKADPDADILAFQAKYHVGFALSRDPSKVLVRTLRATVTPEAFLLDTHHVQLYRGAIDDKAISLGNSRAAALHSWLQDALDDVLSGRPVRTPHTEPIGCLINDK
jgi:thiol-disulfide isomerase/thioredoxin